MEYIHAKWFHQDELDPTDLYYEIDDYRYVLRGIECFANGEITRLTHVEGDIPTVEEINAIKEFSALIITSEAFEDLWQQAQPSL